MKGLEGEKAKRAKKADNDIVILLPFLHFHCFTKKGMPFRTPLCNLNLKLKSTDIMNLVLFCSKRFHLNGAAPDIIVGNIGSVEKIYYKAVFRKMQIGKKPGLNTPLC